jgi:hypothetical protein
MNIPEFFAIVQGLPPEAWAHVFKGMRPAQRRELIDIAEAVHRLEEDGAMLSGVVADQKVNPVTAALPPTQRMTVVGAHQGGGFYEPPSVDTWRPPGQAVIDRMTGG